MYFGIIFLTFRQVVLGIISHHYLSLYWHYELIMCSFMDSELTFLLFKLMIANTLNFRWTSIKTSTEFFFPFAWHYIVGLLILRRKCVYAKAQKICPQQNEHFWHHLAFLNKWRYFSKQVEIRFSVELSGNWKKPCPALVSLFRRFSLLRSH